MALDACFTQKHNKQARDPNFSHSKTVFLSPEEVDAWRISCDERRGTTTRSKAPHSVGDDGFEKGLKVPISVLDACHSSFTAADECQQKASTQFFDSTALMGLLCRHDRVLWLANMDTPGERQHYAFALVNNTSDRPLKNRHSCTHH